MAFDSSRSFFTVAWEGRGAGTTGWDVFARQFDVQTGLPLGDEVRLNSILEGDQRRPALAPLPEGGIAVAWEGPDADGSGIYFRKWGSGLKPLSKEIPAKVLTPGAQTHPAVGHPLRCLLSLLGKRWRGRPRRPLHPELRQEPQPRKPGRTADQHRGARIAALAWAVGARGVPRASSGFAETRLSHILLADSYFTKGDLA